MIFILMCRPPLRRTMFRQMARIAIFAVCGVAFAFAQEQPQQESLGDLARRERARKRAAQAVTAPQSAAKPVVATDNEIIPAHFLVVDGGAGSGDFMVLVNGQPAIRNTRVPGLPPYVSTLLREGTNLLGIQFTSAPDQPLDIRIEERFFNEKTPRVLVRFHAKPNEFPSLTTRQLSFTAHPKLLPPIQITDGDKTAILKLVQTFYDTLVRKDAAGVMALFAPAIEEARSVYPEGAAYGEHAMNNLASFAQSPAIVMEPYSPTGVEIVPNRRVVSVRRTDGMPVFNSNQITAGVNAGASRVSADVILAKKIKGEWRLTLPFGF